MQLMLTILIGILPTITLTTSQDNKPSAADLLEKYAQNQNKLNSSIIVKFELEEKYVKDDEVEIDRVAPAEVRLDGQRIFVCVNQSYDRVFDRIYDRVNDSTKLLDETDYCKFTLWDGERYIKYYDYVEWSTATIRKQNTAVGALADTYPGCPLFGIRYHKIERIDTVLLQFETVSVRDKMETIGSKACYVIDAIGPSSTYTVWLNPKRGYSISQADIQLGPGVQGEYDVVSENESRFFKLRDVQFQQFGEVHVPMAYTEFFERQRNGVAYRKGITHGKITDITFNPDHEKLNSFVPKMRNSTEITNEITGLVFIWQDGKPELGAITLHDEPNSVINSSQDADVTQPGKLLKNHLFLVLVLIPIGLVIIAVLGWLLLCRLKNQIFKS